MIESAALFPVRPFRKALGAALKQEGIHWYIFTGDSMSLGEGGINLFQKVLPEDIRIGDIISFTYTGPNGERDLICHRIHRIDRAGGNIRYITKGDNNEKPDPGYRMYQDIVGVSVAFIPSGPFRWARCKVQEKPLRTWLRSSVQVD